jgi:hypothetical protein
MKENYGIKNAPQAFFVAYGALSYNYSNLEKALKEKFVLK